MPRALLICLLGGLIVWLQGGLWRGTAVTQPAANGVSQPESGALLAGQVVIQGTATDSNYLRYELAFLREAATDAGWIVFAEGDQPVVNGTLAIWDTTVGRAINAPVFPDGRYQLRLRVVRTDYNYTEYYVTNLTIANDEVTPTPTETPEEMAESAATPLAPATPAPDAPGFSPLTPLPSLTPFPTPTLRPTPAGNVAGGFAETPPEDSEGGGVLGQLAAVETGRFSRAFWQGATITGYLFALLFLYLALRGVARYLWRLFWHRRARQ
jgi:hypothetical protein